MSRKYRVVLTGDAQKDIDEIADYIYYTLKAPIAAKNNLKVIRTAIRQLAQYPRRYGFCTEPELFELGIRKQHVRQYVITFMINEQEHRVTVLRVLHTLVEQRLELYKSL